MTRALLVAVGVLVPIGLVALGMLAAWRRRRRRDEHQLAPPPAGPRPDRPPDARVRYTGTTRAGSWLERVALEGLFGRGACELWVEPGVVVFQRVRGPVVRAGPLVAATLERGHAGQAVGRGRVLVVRWRHSSGGGEAVDLDTGFVCRSRAAAEALLARVRADALPRTEAAG